MNVFSFLRRGKKEPSELQKAVIHSVVAGESTRTASEREDAALLGINKPMIEDEGLTKWLDKLAKITVKLEDGSTVEYYDYNVLALRFMNSPVIRTSYVDPIDAEIARLEARRFVHRIELQQPEDSYEYGGTNLLEAISSVIGTGWADAINGRKAKLLKVSPRVFEVNLPEQQKKGEQRSWLG